MKKTQFNIREIRVSGMVCPLGIDIEEPVFSWLLEAEEQGMKQKAARIRVAKAPEELVWDSGRLETDRSIGITYAGEKLSPRTRYQVTVTVWDQNENASGAESWFETGLMAPDQKDWDGARFIGAPEYMLSADSISVYVLEAGVAIEEGDRAGIVFGADDRRLMNRWRNEMLLEGENFIRFVLNVGKAPAELEIWRVGYAPEDRKDQPFLVIPVRDIRTGEEIITPENRRQVHTLRIEVPGNSAYTYVDGHLIDEEIMHRSYGDIPGPRVLNSLGITDVTTYPRLCGVGYYAGEGTTACFPEGIHIRNLRKPSAEIACLDPKGKRICGEKQETRDPSCHSLPMLRREFTVEKELKSARLYATARGIYSCRVNGERISEDFFAPGASQFDHHLMYQTYDITDRLVPGRNAVGCILASGWWCDAFSFLLHNYNFWGDRPSFLAKLVLTYQDGTEDVVVTEPETWQYFGEGPWRYAGFFNGEHYDAGREKLAEEVFEPGFESEELKAPEEIRPVPMPEKEPMFPGAALWPVMNEREPELLGHYQAPVRAVETVAAVSVSEPRKGVFIYDLGQEIAGVPVITLHEKAGRRITIRYSEMLYPDLPRYKGLEGLMLQANLREASNTDVYLCAGRETEVYQPEFTFHGYRYIEITGAENPPAPSDVKSLVLSSVPEIAGSFSCSDPLVNRFWKNVTYSQLSNFISIPTDCPQRNERMGWMGDTHVFCKTADLQSNVKNFYLRNLQAMRDLQTPEGRLPSIAPFGGGFGGQTYESGMILMVWELYQHYGDTDLIREYFPAMDAWMDAMEKAGLPGQPALPPLAWLGDWLAPSPCDPYLLYNAFHYRNARLMETFAELLGKKAGKEKYAAIAEKTKAYWNRTFIDPDSAMTKDTEGKICDTQGGYAAALSCGVAAEEYRERLFAYLARITEEADYTVQTGFFGTGPLNPMLSLGGYEETAGKTMTSVKYPGWLYPVTQGATTVWERWNSFTTEEGFGENNSMNSFDHYSLGSVVSWLYENVLGIQRDEKNPGYRRFILKPETGTFTFAKGVITTPHGEIRSEWEKTEGGLVYRCRIPANTEATLILGEEKHELGSGTYEFTCRP